MTDYRRILFIKPSSLGDVVHAMPTLAALRHRFPRASVTWLVKRQWAGIVERIEGVDAICALEPGPAGWLSKVPRLRAQGFDLAVDLQGLFRSGAMAWLSGCPTRLGLADAREGSGWFYTRTVPVPNREMHAVDRYLLAAQAFGASAPQEPEFRFRPSSDDRTLVSQLLSRQGQRTDRPWIAMNVSARWATKRWPAESFARVADVLQQDQVGRVVLIGGPDERADAEAVTRLMRTQPADVTGLTPLGLLPALLQSVALLVTNDSGPMHIAAAVGTPVVALFGPTSPGRTGPYGPRHLALTSDVPCRPCFSRLCSNQVRLECLTSLSPERVVEAVRAQLAARDRAEAQVEPRLEGRTSMGLDR